jgi:hypothetical protein
MKSGAQLKITRRSFYFPHFPTGLYYYDPAIGSLPAAGRHLNFCPQFANAKIKLNKKGIGGISMERHFFLAGVL